ncbi:hypothetical protein [Bifidobacterium moukalabense]|uniref:hypothetical protein n=1 Tax=Bifidobacterium moukalabense TaxID=1333651 RepID=UPI0010F9DBE3|nr:hypothetical protein [Bifidobacterium moukalabense]
MADETTIAAETAASQNAPETGAAEQPKDNTAPTVAQTVGAKSDTGDDLAEKLGMWKHQARENEQKMYENRDRANAAEAKLADTEGQLAQAQAQIARLTAQKNHPEIPDEAFETLCKETDPEEISKWADSFAKFMPGKPETGEPDETEPDGFPRNTGKQAMKTALANSAPHVHKPAQGDAKSGYEYGLKHSLINSEKE